jgi:hypothetical protein
MLVSDFISLVKEGSLNQTTITEASLIKFINIGLIELFSKFNLSNPTEVITVTEGISEYCLPEEFISVISITTSGEYFRDNLGVIAPITDTTFDVPVNVQGDFNSVFHNSNLVLTVPLQVTGQKYTIVYRAAPTTLTSQMLSSTLDVLPQYLEPLMLYVTYLGFMQNGGGTPTDTNLYLSRYKAAVQELINVGSYQNHYSLDNKFYNRGFV